MGSAHRGGTRKPNDGARIILTTLVGVVFGFFLGASFPTVSLTKINLPSSIISSLDVAMDVQNPPRTRITETHSQGSPKIPKDLNKKPKYLVTFTVGFDQRKNIDAAVKKFSDDFTILLFHYDGRTTEWDQYEWSKNAIHISVKKQTKWWYAKRFLHPDVVAAYEYIFIWDEDLGVQHFNAGKYIELVKKHGLEISQPGLEPNNGLTWQMTKRRGDREVHKDTEEKAGWCSDPRLPPCAAFVEIMAPVFSREAWRCVWHLIQPAHEKIGVVDSQWIVHQVIPSLGSQGKSENGKAPWEGVRARCRTEWAEFQSRLANADKAYLAQISKAKAKRLLYKRAGL